MKSRDICIALLGLVLSLSPALAAEIHDVARNGELPRLKEILRTNAAAVSATTFDGSTALHEAVRSGNKEVVAVLLQAKADPELPDKNGMTAAKLAKGYKRAEILELLETGGQTNQTPRIRSATIGNIQFTNITEVKMLPDGRFSITDANGILPVDSFNCPPAFLSSWGFTAEKIRDQERLAADQKASVDLARETSLDVRANYFKAFTDEFKGFVGLTEYIKQTEAAELLKPLAARKPSPIPRTDGDFYVTREMMAFLPALKGGTHFTKQDGKLTLMSLDGRVIQLKLMVEFSLPQDRRSQAKTQELIDFTEMLRTTLTEGNDASVWILEQLKQASLASGSRFVVTKEFSGFQAAVQYAPGLSGGSEYLAVQVWDKRLFRYAMNVPEFTARQKSLGVKPVSGYTQWK